MDEEYHTPKWWIAVAVASVILILILGYGFVTRASNGLYAEKVAYLEEISVKGAALVTAQVSGYFSTLEAMSTVIGREDDFSADSALAILRPEAEKGFFKRMGIIMPDGIAYTTDGYKEDFSDRVYFHTAMTGERAVSDCLVDKIGGEAINVFAAPVYRDDTIICTVFVTKSQEELSKALTFESFCGEGYSYIVSGDGRPVVQTTHPASIGNYTDFFASMLKCGVTEEQVTTVRRQMAANDTGVLEYKRDGISRQIFYAPVGINNWYIFSVVPSQAISMQSDRLIRNLCILVVLWVLLSMAICSRMLHSFRLNNKRLSHIAYTDATTGHPNWARFRLEAQRLLKENPDRHYAMIAFDINKFKLINDLFGYQRGDEILTFVGDVLARCMQEEEIFCRAAADHFNLLLNFEGEDALIHRLKCVEDELDGAIENYKVKISTGICTITDREFDVSAYSDKANISRSIAKRQNFVNYHFFKDENRVELLREKEIENSMDAALDHGEFEVYLQPKYSCITDKIVGAEALVRWRRPCEGLVSPNEFIPLFEKNGFIRKLDLYMFENVCQLMAHWQRSFPQVTPLSISVNISRTHLSNPALPANLRQIAMRYGVPPEFLEIELTESAIFENMEEMHLLMDDLKKAGFQLSIDDFGSGYSSLASLKSLPADIVKMDKSFLDEAENDKRGEKIICSIVEMIKGLGMTAVAEGVETREQLAFLKTAGCDIVQGYYWAKPMPAEAFETLVFQEVVALSGVNR